MQKLLARFRSQGGVHPEYHKERTATLPIVPMPLAPRLLVSCAQHIGAPSKPTVKKGDTVRRGQAIAEPAGFVSAWVHAPANGTVKSVEDQMTASGRVATVIEIETQPDTDMASPLQPHPDPAAVDRSEITKIVSAAGIIGMGGAGFPTHVKLSPPPDKKIERLLINGAECEPYLTADHRLMLEQADRICAGARIIARALDTPVIQILIEDNKPDAIAALEAAVAKSGLNADIVVLRTEYPQGAEKQLIYSSTGREVPSGGLPMHVGALVENVGTAAAIFDAVVDGIPLTERVLTVTGDAVASPRNIRARVGTPFADILAFCGGTTPELAKLICGGPMMGIAQTSPDGAVQKTTSGLLALSRKSVSYFSSMPCIACGRCVGACPMKLVPSALSQYIEAEDYALAEEFNVLDCIECGCCAYVCPAHRPMVQHMKSGKAQVTAIRRQREQKPKPPDTK